MLPSNTDLARDPGLENHLSRDIETLYTTVTSKATPALHHNHGSPPRPPKLDPLAPMASIRALIWSHAAMLYNYTASSLWRTDDIGVMHHVGHIVGLLAIVPKEQLRTLAWPILIAGCLSSEGEKASFSRVLTELNKVQTIGPLSDARRLIQIAWRNRATSGHDRYEQAFASTLALLSTPMLII